MISFVTIKGGDISLGDLDDQFEAYMYRDFFFLVLICPPKIFATLSHIVG